MTKQNNETLTTLITASINDSKEFIGSFSKPHLAIEWITNEVIGQYYLDTHGSKTEAAKAMGATQSHFVRKYLSKNMANMRIEGVTPVIHRVVVANSEYPLLTIFWGVGNDLSS